MLGTRVLGYGSEYTVNLTDPDTGLETEHTFDLGELEFKKVDYDLFKSGENNFEYTLPKSGRVLTFKLLTSKDEKEIEEVLKGYEKINAINGVSPELTTRLKKQITSVDGKTDTKTISNFVDNEFLALDTREFRKYVGSVSPDVVFETEYTSQIGEPHKVNVPLGVRFFWPESTIS